MFLLSILILAILTIGAVSASEEISDDVLVVEPVDDIVLEDSSDDSQVETTEDEEILSEDDLSFTDLKNELTSDKTEIILEKDYKYRSGDPTTISTPRNKAFVLDGSGHTIDGDGNNFTLDLNSANVVVKNVKFKNFYKETTVGADSFIKFYGNNSVLENCTFENMATSTVGGIVFFGGGYGNQTVNQCTFENNNIGYIMVDFWSRDCVLNNTKFINNSAARMANMDYGKGMNNCTFIDNRFSEMLISTAALSNSKFINNTGLTGYNGNICLIYLFYNNSQINNCIFENNSAKNEYGYRYIIRAGYINNGNPLFSNVNISNCNFTDNLALPIAWCSNGNISGCNFINNLGTIEVNATLDIQRGDYDFEVIANNNTTIGNNSEGIGMTSLYSTPTQEVNKTIVTFINRGAKQEGTLYIYLNDVECFKKEMDSDTAVVSIDDLEKIVKCGYVNLLVKFNCDKDFVIYNGTLFIDYYIVVSYLSDFYHNQIPWDNNIYLNPHQTKDIAISLPDGATGTLTVNDGINSHLLDSNTFTLNVSNHPLGSHIFSVSLTDDPIYPNKSLNYYFTVQHGLGISSYISLDDIETLVYDLPDNYNGDLTIYNRTEDGEKGAVIKKFSGIKGKGRIPVDFLQLGENHIILVLSGDYYYEQSRDITCFKNDPRISVSIDSNTIKPGTDAIIRLTVPNASNYIDVYEESAYWNGYEELSGNTSYVLNFSNLGLGEHKIKVLVYDWDDVNYRSTYLYSKTFTINVTDNIPPVTPVTVPAKIIAKDYSAFYNKGTYSVTVYGPDGKVAKGVSVVFKINGKKIATVKTNANGVAKVKIAAKYVPKTYKISATALGKTITKKLKIKQVLKLKKVAVKKSAKKLVITATLKEGKKAIKGKKIIFRFNGKKYTKKTNKKGIAKITIKKKVLKNLKKGKKVKYQATYLKDTVKRTVKVKK